jgi:hypothetical protein
MSQSLWVLALDYTLYGAIRDDRGLLACAADQQINEHQNPKPTRDAPGYAKLLHTKMASRGQPVVAAIRNTDKPHF